MTYDITITANAKAEIEAVHLWLAEHDRQRAQTWFDGITRAIDGLSRLPLRSPRARESRHFDEPVHQLLFGKKPNVYRVLYVVRERKVLVLHVRHGSRRALRRRDLKWPP